MPEKSDGLARGRWRLPVALTAAALGVLLAGAQLFGHPAVGVADNGDGWRLMCPAGLAPYPHRVLYTGVVLTYAPQPAAVTRACAPSLSNPFSYRTSQSVVLAVARMLGGGSHASRFDLRWMGAVDLALLAVAFAIGALVAARSRWPLVLCLGVIGVMALDIGWVAYFNSPLSEPASITGSLLLLAALPLWLGAARGRTWRSAALALLLVGSTLLVTAKPQDAVLAAAIAPLVVRGRLELGRHLRGRVGGRALPAVVALLVLALGPLEVGAQGRGFDRINQNDGVFYGVLLVSRNVDASLDGLRLPDALARYVGRGWYPSVPGRLHDPAYLRFESTATRADLLGYLADHPVLSLRLFDKAAGTVAVTREDALGEYPANTAQGRQLRYASGLTPATSLLLLTRSVGHRLFPVVWLLAAVAGVVLLLRRRCRYAWRATGGLLFFLGAGAALSDAAVVLGEGLFSVQKHEMLTAFYTAPLLVLLPALLAGEALARASRRGLPRPRPRRPRRSQ